jgi:hypothetical protein
MNAVPEGYLADAKGRLVKATMVRPQDLLEDQMVREVMVHADELSAQIARFRLHCFDDIAAFLDVLREKYGGSRGGTKGNMTFSSFDGCFKIQVAIADRLTFGPELQVAKEKIDECIADWSADASDHIRVLVQHAFQTDKEGLVNREAIFALRRVEINDERWQQAMAAIGGSIRIEGSKSYLRFYRRPSPEAAWTAVTIDLAATS